MLAVVAVLATAIVVEPSKLPIVLPVALIKPLVVPIAIAINAELAVVVDALLVVWLIAVIVLFDITVAGAVVLTLAASIALNSFEEPESVVVPVPFAAAKPMVLPLTVKLPVELFSVTAAWRTVVVDATLAAVW